jgi:hypothetical protein
MTDEEKKRVFTPSEIASLFSVSFALVALCAVAATATNR